MRPNIDRIVFDASALINLEDSGRLDTLTRLGLRILVPAKVEEELRKIPRGGQRPGRGFRRMSTWLQRRSFQLAVLLPDESTDYLKYRSTLGAGESAAMAIAGRRHLLLVMDDGPAAKAAALDGITVISHVEFASRLANGDFGIL